MERLLLLPRTTAVAAAAAAVVCSRRRRSRRLRRRNASPLKLVEQRAAPLALLALASESPSRPLLVDGWSLAVMSTVDSGRQSKCKMAGEGDVEDLERDEGVVVVRGRSGGGGGAVAAVAVAGAAAASASPGEVLRAQNELDRLFCLFVCFVLIRSSWSWKGMKKSVRCLFVLFFSSESVCQPCLSKRGTTQPRQRRRRQN